MNRRLFLAAAAVALVAHAWVLVSARYNRGAAPGGTLELTERELRLPFLLGDSTAMLMDLQWAIAAAPEKHRPFPDWLDQAKLSELGFDCQVPVTSPDARDHYRSQPPRLVYLVLEFEGEAWKQAGSDHVRGTRLFVTDAGRDPVRLRERHPDTRSKIITRGLVRLLFEDHNFRDGTKLVEPRLRGSIPMVLPNQVFVPRPFSGELQGLRPRAEESEGESNAEPRYAVTVAWGRNYEPWVQDLRRLP